MIGIILSNMSNLRQTRLLLLGVVGALFVLGLTPAGASSANISHSYKSTEKLDIGSMVSIDPSKTDYVQAADTSNGVRLLGVSVGKNDSLLAVDETDGATQVATSGSAKTLVSTLNGPIVVGDQIGVSPFKGIGMKALPESRVIGLAQSSFSSTSPGATSQEVTDKSGKKSTVQVGYVSVSIAPGVNNTGNGLDKLTALQRFGRSLTGHTVSTLRVVISLTIALVALASLITLIYASIYGGIISIGRNPLAKYAVFRTIGAVLGMVAVTAGIAGTIIFLLLR